MNSTVERLPTVPEAFPALATLGDARQQLAHLSEITVNGKEEDPYAASYFLAAVVHQIRR